MDLVVEGWIGLTSYGPEHFAHWAILWPIKGLLEWIGRERFGPRGPSRVVITRFQFPQVGC